MLQFQTRQGTSLLRGLGIYDIFEAIPGEATLRRVGQSNSHGRFVLEPDSQRSVQTLYVRSGNTILAKLPIVRGLNEVLAVSVADDPARLRAEAALLALQEEFIDTQARREILTLRLEKAKDEKAVQAMRLELGRLKGEQQFRTDWEQLRLRFRSSDQAVQHRIDRMFRDTRKALNLP